MKKFLNKKGYVLLTMFVCTVLVGTSLAVGDPVYEPVDSMNLVDQLLISNDAWYTNYYIEEGQYPEPLYLPLGRFPSRSTIYLACNGKGCWFNDAFTATIQVPWDPAKLPEVVMQADSGLDQSISLHAYRSHQAWVYLWVRFIPVGCPGSPDQTLEVSLTANALFYPDDTGQFGDTTKLTPLQYINDETGYIGLGTTEPTGKITIKGGGIDAVHVYSNPDVDHVRYGIGTTSNTMNLYTGGNRLILGKYNPDAAESIDAWMNMLNGHVGIGIGGDYPIYPLVVNGMIYTMQDGIKFPDETIQTTAAKGDGYSLDTPNGEEDVVFVSDSGDFFAPDLIDSAFLDDQSQFYYLDPNQISYLNSIIANNIAFYQNNELCFNVTDGSHHTTLLEIKDTSHSKLTVYGNIEADKVYDRNDADYYINPNYISKFRYIDLDGSIISSWDDIECDGEDDDWIIIDDDMCAGISGNVGIGVSNPNAKLTVKANDGQQVLFKGYNDNNQMIIEIGEGLDYAESFPVDQHQDITAGTVVCIDPEHPGKLTQSTEAYDKKVAGIISGANNLNHGIRLGDIHIDDLPVALAGRVYCKVDSSYGSIRPGDLLTTSPTPGHAMIVTDYLRGQGAILGKAMESISDGSKGEILVLVTLQ